MSHQVLVVCLGNICRSPVAEGFVNHHARKEGLSLKASSAGLSAMVGDPADPFSIKVAQDQGVNLAAHRARQLTLSMVKEADLIWVMTKDQRQEICETYPFAAGKTFRLGHWRRQEIFDPYRLPFEAFVAMSRDIENCLGDWYARL